MAIWSKTNQELNFNNTDQYEVVMLADKDGNIINSSGAASNIPIAEGTVTGYTHLNKFGYSNDIQTLSTIWDNSSIYQYSSVAGAITVESNAATNGDDGAVIEVQGLDANYNTVVQDVVISGSTGVGAVDLIRIFRARVKMPAVGESSNVGDISIDIDNALRAKILAGKGQTLMSLYTVPAGKTAYFLNITMSVDKNVDVLFKIFSREFGEAFNIKGQFGTFGTPIDHNYPIPLRFEEKSDIEIQAVSGNQCGGGATFDIILVDNPV